MLKTWFRTDELKGWVDSTWGFMKQIFPLLGAGVLVAGFMLGRPGYPALIPEAWIQIAVGGNSLWANLFASVAGALMYFATLTEVPILQGLLGAGMGKGAGPGPAFGRSRPQSAQHAGHRRGDGLEKDGRVLLNNSHPVDIRRVDLRGGACLTVGRVKPVRETEEKMEIKVLGPGCAKCKKTEEVVRAAVAESNADAQVDKVTDMMEIATYGVFGTPAVVIDGEVKSVGKVPSKDEVKGWLA